MVFTHPPVATIGLTEKAALEEYGEDQVKIYRSSFTPMYFALGEYRQKCDMKLICVGKEEKIVGLQTDVPLKQAFMPFGGIKMANNALVSNGYETDEEMTKIFTEYRKTHNQGVFDAYTAEMRLARKNKIITGLPDAYGRGRIIGDYRRIALYGIDYLMEQKKKDHDNTGNKEMTDDVIRLREEISEQYNGYTLVT